MRADYAFFESAYVDPSTTSALRVRWISLAMQQEEFLRLSTGDVAFSATSMLFVFAYIWIHTGSIWLTATGTLHARGRAQEAPADPSPRGVASPAQPWPRS